jgi:hypothetical protein
LYLPSAAADEEEVWTKRLIDGVSALASRAAFVTPMAAGMTTLGSGLKETSEATWTIPAQPGGMHYISLRSKNSGIDNSCWYRLTFKRLKQIILLRDIFHLYQLEFTSPIHLIEMLLQPRTFLRITDSSSDLVSKLEKLIYNMTADITITTCNKNCRSLGENGVFWWGRHV